MKIYLTRHSKTVWNEEKRLQGRLDSPLTNKGIENAYSLKEYIKDMKFDYVFSSPILRAYTTAKILFDERNIIQDERLVEMNFGEFEGKKISEIINNSDKLYYQLWHEPHLFTRIPQGESYDEVIGRVNSFLNDLKQYPNQSNIFIVTHGMFFIVLLATMLGLEKKYYTKINQKVVDGCSLTCVNYENDTFTLEIYNECSFLPYVSKESFAK